MYKRILMAYDGSEAGQKALLDCGELAQWSHAEVVLVAVMPSMMAFVGLEGGVYDAELENRERQKFEGILNDGLRQLEAAGFRATGEVRTGEAGGDHRLRPQGQGRPDRGGPQAPGRLGRALVARFDLRGVDRARPVQRAVRDPELS